MNTLAIASGKGGVGKSFLALNLAWALAEIGQRVLLVELDADAGALSIAAGLGEPKARAPAQDAAQMAERIHAVPGNSRIQLLRAMDIPAPAARSPAALTPLLQGLSAHWRIVDLPPGLGAQSVLWMRGGAPSMLIGTPELVCVQAMLRLHLQLRRQHAYEWLCTNEPRLREGRASLTEARQRLAAMLGAEQAELRWQQALRSQRSCHWIFNRVLPDDSAQLTRIAAYLRVHAGSEAAQPRLIPEDAAQLACARIGRPLLGAYTGSPAAQAIRGIASELVAQHLPTLRATG